MQSNMITTLLALLFYITSGLFGGNSNSTLPLNPSNSYNPSNQTNNNVFPFSGTLTGKQANLRSEPISSSKIIDKIETNSRLIVLDQKNGFYLIETENSKQGWIPAWMISIQHNNYRTNQKKVIAGYYVENYRNDPVGYQALNQNLEIINTLIPFSFKVNQYGTISSSHNPRPVSLARSAGVMTLALVNNINGENFDSSSIHHLLTNSGARLKAITGITRVITENGYQGVNIDFENIPSRDRTYLTEFFRELAAELHPRNLLVTASLPAKTFDDFRSSHSGAFDYRKLASYLDQAMIMTYDEHFSGGVAGPVASYPWVKQVVNYTLRNFPANKIVLGIAAYGYDWGWDSGKALNYKAIQSLIRNRRIIPQWHSVYKVPYFTYSSWGIKHKVWYEDRYSTAAKTQIVKEYGLRGVAVWRLGYEDPGIWHAIQQQLSQ